VIKKESTLKFSFLGLVILSAVSMTGHGAGASKEVTIQQLHPISKSRADTAGKAITRVYVNSVTWGNTTCRADAIDIDGEDKHIMSILLSSWIAGKKITVNVDDSAKLLGSVCKVMSLNVK
jgi:hypothetical protein